MQRLHLLLLILALVAGLSGGWPRSADAMPASHASGGCHDETPAPDKSRPGDAVTAQHFCLGCGVLAERSGEPILRRSQPTASRPRRATPVLASHMIGPDTPPPRLVV